MTPLNIIPSLLIILLCQLVGVVVQKGSGLPIPAPVIGMTLLFIGLLIRGSLSEHMQHTALGLLRYLALLFIPAGVGVMQQFDVVAREWLPITMALLVSCALPIALTGVVMQFVLKKKEEATHD